MRGGLSGRRVHILSAAGFALALAAGAGVWAQEAAVAKVAETAQPACFVAADGKAENTGTLDSPWDLDSAVSGQKKIDPGTTIYLRGGVYRKRPADPKQVHGEKCAVRLVGAEGKPIQIRPYGDERVTIDGGFFVFAPAAHVWMRDLEIMISEPNPLEPVTPGSAPENFFRPYGGLDIQGGESCKFINLVIHHCRGGFGFWKDALNNEIYGCIIYDNGWWGTDRGHGHAIYAQNEKPTKTISDCIMTGGYSYTMHAYGSGRAYVDNFVIEGNIAYDAGSFLVGGGRPSHNCKVLNNFLYNVPMRIGYSAPENFDCEVRGNVLAHAGMQVTNYKSGRLADNLLVDGKVNLTNSADVAREGDKEISAAEAAKQDALVVLRPNKYDPKRANLAVYNWKRALCVQIDASAFLKDGEKYILKDPRFFYGAPVHWGACEKGKITVPLYHKEFAAFVMLKAQ